MRPRLLFTCSMVLAVLVAFAGTGVGQTGYAVSAAPAVDTPDREVTFDGQPYEVSHLGRVEPGGSVSATVSAPAGDAYDVYLYDADRDILDRHRDPEAATVSFDVPADDPAYAPGTYVVAVDHDGEFRAVAPVVIAGYRVSVDAPGSAEAGSSITVEATLTTIDDGEPVDRVQVVIGDDDDTRRVTLSPDGDGYSATFALDSLSEGEYSLYVVVQGSAQVLGRQEVLGVSDSQTLSVESAETTSDDGSDGSDDGSSGVASDGSATTDAQTTGAPTETATGTTASATTADPTTETSTGTSTTSSASSTTTTDDSVITPNQATTADPTETPGQPLGALPPLVALALVAVLARRRR